jgi:nucleotide-binding universal stress UspA family protein
MNPLLSELSCDHFGIKAKRLLLPIDLAKCPLEIFPLANAFTKPFEGAITVLHVFDRRRNVAPRRASETELRRAEQHLKRIGDDYLSPTVEAFFRVRIGIPGDEILAEAKATNVDLVLLPRFVSSVWRRLAGYAYGETTRNLVRDASCRVFVVDVRTRFNCFRRWARKEDCILCTT